MPGTPSRVLVVDGVLPEDDAPETPAPVDLADFSAVMAEPVPDYQIGDTLSIQLSVEVCDVRPDGSLRVRALRDWGGYRYWDWRPPGKR